jgi:IS30 family transposase
LNTRPRKVLGFMTPLEAFEELTAEAAPPSRRSRR